MKRIVPGLLAAVLTAGAWTHGRATEPEKTSPVEIVVGPRRASATPVRQGHVRTGGGNIRLVQSAPDTVVISMTAAAATGLPLGRGCVAGFNCELEQCFDIVFNDSKLKGAKLTLDGQTIGLLRSRSGWCHGGGNAEVSTPGRVSLHCGPSELLVLDQPHRAACCGLNIAVNDHEGPISIRVVPGRYELRQVFGITAAQGAHSWHCRAASADFAPGEVFKEEWIGKCEPFRGISKKEFGFQVTLKVAPDNADQSKNGKP